MAPHKVKVPINVAFCPVYLDPAGATGKSAVTHWEVAEGGLIKYLPVGGVGGFQATQLPTEEVLHPLFLFPAVQAGHGTWVQASVKIVPVFEK
jgi:hypothetical protein